MPLNSYEFLLAFLPITVAGFWILHRFASGDAAIRWLTLASIVFYSQASLHGLLLIIPSILLDYLIALALLRHPSRQRLQSMLFAIGVVANVLFLGYFKYRNFFIDTTNSIFDTHFSLVQLVVPLGISFIVFQKIAFLADVRAQKLQSVRFLDFLFFTLFFPRAIAGPITHYQEIIPQLSSSRLGITSANLTVGAALFSIGLFKKTVIADRIAQYVTPTFDPLNFLSEQPLTLLATWTSALAFTFQLYFDFSGYSDMALGLARMFGISLPMNFNSPLKATSIVEFWSRWHVTLTRFLTAYIYTPVSLHLTRSWMARSQPSSTSRRQTVGSIALLIGVPTFVTMIISGLWHGAGWQFLAWGALHGLFLAVNQCWRVLRPRFWPDDASYHRIMRPVGFLLTFSAVVSSFVLFRAPSLAAAIEILRGMLGMNGILPYDLQILHRLGAPISLDIIWYYQPLTPILWMTGLFIAVICLPNSLDLLRRFHPAADFPQSVRQMAPPATTSPPAPPHGSGLMRRIRSVAMTLARIKRDGIDASPAWGVLIALSFVVSVMAISGNRAFIYAQF